MLMKLSHCLCAHVLRAYQLMPKLYDEYLVLRLRNGLADAFNIAKQSQQILNKYRKGQAK